MPRLKPAEAAAVGPPWLMTMRGGGVGAVGGIVEAVRGGAARGGEGQRLGAREEGLVDGGGAGLVQARGGGGRARLDGEAPDGGGGGGGAAHEDRAPGRGLQ